MDQSSLFKGDVHGLRLSYPPWNDLIPDKADHSRALYIKPLAVKPKLPPQADWESHLCNSNNVPLILLYCEDEKYFMEFTCQGRGVFVFEKEKACIEVYWETIGTSFHHYLLTTGLAMVLEFRGVPCLHGNTLALKGKGFGLLGTSGAGKSSLSRALALKSCQIMSDDMLSVQSSNNHWDVSSSAPLLRLWPDSLDALFSPASVANAPRVHSDYDKFSLNADYLADQYLENASLPLHALYILERKDSRNTSSKCWIEDLSSTDALIALIRESVLSDAPKVLGLEVSRLKKLSQLVSGIPVKRLCYTSGYDYLPEVCDRVIQDLDSIGRMH